MSATTDRLDELAAQTAPLPWPVDAFYYGQMTGDQFQLTYALTQAWPLLRTEILELEAAVLALGKENAQLHNENARVVSGATALGRDLADLRERHATAVNESAEAHRVQEEEIDRLNGLVSKLPIKALAADAVCASFTTTKQGSGGAHGWIDGEALDAWRKAKAGED